MILVGCSAGSPEDRALEAIKVAIIKTDDDNGIVWENSIDGIRCHVPETPEGQRFVGDKPKTGGKNSGFSMSTECTVDLKKNPKYFSYSCTVKFPSEDASPSDISAKCTDITAVFEAATDSIGTGFDGETLYRESPKQIY